VTIYCISCVSRKQAGAHPARDLYTSDWFRKARAVVEAQLKPGDKVFILSALYGAVEWTQEIETYDARLTDKSGDYLRRWHTEVARTLLEQALPPETPETLRVGVDIVVYAGEQYRRLWPGLLAVWSQIPLRLNVPLEGLGIGQQVSALMKMAADQTIRPEVFGEVSHAPLSHAERGQRGQEGVHG
jgi:hypothetical protein